MSRNGPRRIALWLAIVGGGLGIAGVIGGAAYQGVAWASRLQSDDDVRVVAAGAESRAVDKVLEHEKLETEMHTNMLQRIDTNTSEIRILREESKEWEREQKVILRELYKRQAP